MVSNTRILTASNTSADFVRKASKDFGNMNNISNIKRRWGVEHDAYRRIWAALERLLKDIQMLGTRIQGTSAILRLDEAIDTIIDGSRLANIFSQLQVEKEQLRIDLRTILQNINHCERKRKRRGNTRKKKNITSGGEDRALVYPPRECDGYLSTSSSLSRPATPVDTSPPLNGGSDMEAAFRSCTIVVRKQDGRTRTYRPQEFCGRKRKANFIIDDLDFNRFEELLALDVGYHKEEDGLFYVLRDNESAEVNDDAHWKAALWFMFRRRDEPIAFHVAKRQVDEDRDRQSSTSGAAVCTDREATADSIPDRTVLIDGGGGKDTTQRLRLRFRSRAPQ